MIHFKLLAFFTYIYIYCHFISINCFLIKHSIIISAGHQTSFYQTLKPKFTKLRDQTAKNKISHVIYEIQCNNSYIDLTTQYLGKKIMWSQI